MKASVVIDLQVVSIYSWI